MGNLIWLVGESNPYGGSALFPSPRTSSGARLCYDVLGLKTHEYLTRFRRTNLLCLKDAERWSAPAARRSAELLVAQSKGAVMMLLGARVSRAFDLDYVPNMIWQRGGQFFGIVPNPSARSQAWNDPRAITRARSTLRVLEELSK